MKKKYWFFVLTSLFSFFVQAQDKNKDRIMGRMGESFPYGFRNFTYIQPRFDRLNFPDDKYFNTYMVRGAKTFFENTHLRMDLPFATSNTSGSVVSGLSDIKMRLMHVSPVVGRLFVGYGSEFTLPTATETSLGAGKWQARPEIGLLYFFGQPEKIRGTALFQLDYRWDFAGADDRNHISVLGIVPNVDYWAEKWYVGYYATWTYDFINKIWDIPVDLEFGYLIIPKITLSVEYIQPLLRKRTYNSEYTAKLKYSF